RSPRNAVRPLAPFSARRGAAEPLHAERHVHEQKGASVAPGRQEPCTATPDIRTRSLNRTAHVSGTPKSSVRSAAKLAASRAGERKCSGRTPRKSSQETCPGTVPGHVSVSRPRRRPEARSSPPGPCAAPPPG